MTEEKRIQLIDQCKAIVHMANAIASVHADIAKLNAVKAYSPEITGEFTAARMETLGDMLNNMDAVTEDDDWLSPIFKKAHAAIIKLEKERDAAVEDASMLLKGMKKRSDKLEQENAKLRGAQEILEWINYHKDNQDMNHVVFRVEAGSRASNFIEAAEALRADEKEE